MEEPVRAKKMGTCTLQSELHLYFLPEALRRRRRRRRQGFEPQIRKIVREIP